MFTSFLGKKNFSNILTNIGNVYVDGVMTQSAQAFQFQPQLLTQVCTIIQLGDHLYHNYLSSSWFS